MGRYFVQPWCDQIRPPACERVKQRVCRRGFQFPKTQMDCILILKSVQKLNERQDNSVRWLFGSNGWDTVQMNLVLWLLDSLCMLFYLKQLSFLTICFLASLVQLQHPQHTVALNMFHVESTVQQQDNGVNILMLCFIWYIMWSSVWMV